MIRAATMIAMPMATIAKSPSVRFWAIVLPPPTAFTRPISIGARALSVPRLEPQDLEKVSHEYDFRIGVGGHGNFRRELGAGDGVEIRLRLVGHSPDVVHHLDAGGILGSFAGGDAADVQSQPDQFAAVFIGFHKEVAERNVAFGALFHLGEGEAAGPSHQPPVGGHVGFDDAVLVEDPLELPFDRFLFQRIVVGEAGDDRFLPCLFRPLFRDVIFGRDLSVCGWRRVAGQEPLALVVNREANQDQRPEHGDQADGIARWNQGRAGGTRLERHGTHFSASSTKLILLTGLPSAIVCRVQTSMIRINSP